MEFVRMELPQLRCFVAVAEALSFRRAAERLHVTQPSVSRHVQQLEEELAPSCSFATGGKSN
jgi:DNA-binding transcriptional LysR family regulator